MRNQRLTASGGTILSPITGRLGSLLGLTGLVADAGFWDAAFWDRSCWDSASWDRSYWD
jgi:hypothetical protein